MSLTQLGHFCKNHDIPWGNFCGVCTDGAQALQGCRSGLQRLVISASPKAIGTHCMIHRKVLATKILPQEFQDIMKSAVSVVNFAKTSASTSSLFSKLCRELDASNNVLLFHTDVRWLSRSKVLTRVFDLRDELKTVTYCYSYFHQLSSTYTPLTFHLLHPTSTSLSMQMT